MGRRRLWMAPKLYHIYRREMQPIKQWKQKQDYILICGSSTVYIIVKLCLMFNSLLIQLYKIKRFLQKAENFYFVYKRTFVHLLCNAKEILTVLTIFSTNNRKSEELKLQSFFSDWQKFRASYESTFVCTPTIQLACTVQVSYEHALQFFSERSGSFDNRK